MKKVTVFTLVLVGFASIATAQFSAGVKGGVSLNNVHADVYIDAVNNSPRGMTGYQYGIATEYQAHKNIAFMAEVLTTSKGFIIDESTSFSIAGIDVPVGGKASTTFQYIETPLLVKGIWGNSTIQGYGVVGPSIGYATHASIQPKVTLLLDWNLPSVELDLNEGIYNRWNTSGIIGGGGQMSVGSGKVFADVRYQFGLNDFINDTTVDLTMRHNSWQFSAGYAHTF